MITLSPLEDMRQLQKKSISIDVSRLKPPYILSLYPNPARRLLLWNAEMAASRPHAHRVQRPEHDLLLSAVSLRGVAH
jgi:hypothetical protein